MSLGTRLPRALSEYPCRSAPMLRFERLLAPTRDAGVLIEPPAAAWPALIEQNRRLLATATARIAGRPLAEVREQTRAALAGSDVDDRPLIVAGHQPDFVHPGVWAKHVAVRHLVDSNGWGGLDLVVDNDAPTSASLVVPTIGAGNLVATAEVALRPGHAGSAHEARQALSPGQLAKVRERVLALAPYRAQGTMLPAYLDGLGTAAGGDFVDQHLAGRHAVDEPLGATLPEARVSRAFDGPLLAHLLIDAGGFAACYNAALAQYRIEQGVRSPDRPLPDLGRRGERVEAAFWVYQPGRPRLRLWVARTGERLAFFADQLPIGECSASELARDAQAALAALHPWVVRPRALTLTLWARLTLGDLFVHGIGGAKYDRINDAIIRGYFKLAAPAYACVSATMRLPLPSFGTGPGELAHVRRRLREMWFKAAKYIPWGPADLLERRWRLVRESQTLRQARGDRLKRRCVWLELREVNRRIVESCPEVLRETARLAEEAAGRVASNRAAGGREYFYALQPRARLEHLAEAIRHRLDAGD